MYQIRITCGPKYPEEPPTFQFVQKVAIPSISKTGVVDTRKFGWKRTMYIMDLLIKIEAQIMKNAGACAKIIGTY